MEYNTIFLIFLMSIMISGLIYFLINYYLDCKKVNNIQINYDKDINLSDTEITINKNNNVEISKPVETKKSAPEDTSYELIFYWANWCGICQKVKPLWKNARVEIEKRYDNIKVKEINCDNPSTDKCFIKEGDSKNSLEGVPTILLRKNGKNDIEYKKSNQLKGNRTKEDLLKFLKININK